MWPFRAMVTSAGRATPSIRSCRCSSSARAGDPQRLSAIRLLKAPPCGRFTFQRHACSANHMRGGWIVEQAVVDVSRVIGERRACKHVGVPRASFKRRQRSFQKHVALTVSHVDSTPCTTSIQEPLATGSRHVRRQEFVAIHFAL
jgi:hypothetical protein